MNEPSPPPTSPSPSVAATPGTSATRGAPGAPPWLAWTALGTAVLALAGVIAVAVQTQSRDAAVQQALGEKVADLDRQLGQSAALTRRLQTQVIDTQNRLEQFETQLADTQTQRIALEEMYRELSRAPDDWLLAEVEQTLNIAAQQLAVAGNAKAAIGALQSADARLARADKLQTAAMRRAINADLEKLKALPWVDLTGMTVKLDALVQQIDTLPLASGPGSIVATPPANIRKPEDGWFTRLADDAWREIRELVRIRKVGAEETGLLTPNQTYFLKENLKLRLLSARMALLARDETNYREDLKLARAWIAKYFDVQAKPTAAALANLKVLQDSSLNIALPDINASLNAVGAVRAARAARETSKGGR
ncbi:MAG: uroporphyrinogen-III C-methyltransferase [Burkholderiales bacterium]|nr:uroporphyrinogen-III C-methyltransferase [Burkholderiales bacterium]